jgi:NF-X1-type zinc finger protein NFXL1
LQKYLAQQQSIKSTNSSDDSSEDDDGSGGDQHDELLEKVFQSYSLSGSGNDAKERTKEAIVNSMKRGLNSCLICIGSIKKNDAIWNCVHCCCSFHINCIQRWGKDSIFQQKQDIESGPGIFQYTFIYKILRQ